MRPVFFKQHGKGKTHFNILNRAVRTRTTHLLKNAQHSKAAFLRKTTLDQIYNILAGQIGVVRHGRTV